MSHGSVASEDFESEGATVSERCVVQSAYKAEQHTVDKLGSTVKRLKVKLFNGCEAQLL